MGKNFANRKPVTERPDNDFYETPKCMILELLNAKDNGQYIVPSPDKFKTVLDPCCGKFAITSVLSEFGYDVDASDLMYGEDFLKDYVKKYDGVIMNPPFKLFNQFVEKAKKVSPYVCSIGKLNFFGAHDRNVNGLWEHLEWVLPFDRQIAFDRPIRADGKVECGMMVTGWFIWNQKYNGYPKIKVLDMNEYIARKK